MKKIKFLPAEKSDFYRDLRRRVNSYFKEHNRPKHGNFWLTFKAIVMFSLLFLPWGVLYIIPDLHIGWLIGLGLISGVGQSGIGLSVMHDALHSSFFANKKWNRWLGEFSMIFIGGFASNWKMQHNQLHHSYTNVHGMDMDIAPPTSLLRFSPYVERNSLHRYQHLYAWFLYCLQTISWVISKDFRDLRHFKKIGLYEGREKEFSKNLWLLIIHRLLYVVFYLVLPIMFTSYGILQLITMLLFKHFFSGFVLAVVFQPAHVSQGTIFENGEVEEPIEEDWAIHQMKTTVNFAMTNRILNWYAGGLNFQIEHHLFPTISHIHYPRISKIVQETAREYGIPYLHHPSFRSAMMQHAKTLYQLGRA